MDRGAWCVTVHGVTKSQTGLRDEHTQSQRIQKPFEQLTLLPITFGENQNKMKGSMAFESTRKYKEEPVVFEEKPTKITV